MNFKHVYAIVLRQYYLIRKNPTRFNQYFVWATIDIILWGFITKYLTTVAGSGYSFTPVLLGAVLLWNFLIRIMQGITTAFFEDIWSRNFLNLFASPLSLGEYVTGLVLTTFCTSGMAIGVVMVIAWLFFGFSILSFGIGVLAFFFVLILFGIALGVLGVSIVLRLGPSAEWFIWPIPAILSPFVGVFYPIAILPSWMQMISYALPPSYVFEGLRNLILNHVFSYTPLVIGGVLAVLYIALAYGFLRMVYRYITRTGLLARYSAENSG